MKRLCPTTVLIFRRTMFNPVKIDIEKKHPMLVSDQGVEGEGFTHCLSNPNTLSLTA